MVLDISVRTGGDTCEVKDRSQEAVLSQIQVPRAFSQIRTDDPLRYLVKKNMAR